MEARAADRGRGSAKGGEGRARGGKAGGMEVKDRGWQQEVSGYGFNPAPDAGGAGDGRGSGFRRGGRPPRRRLEGRAVARGLRAGDARAVRELGEATPRAIAREPVETVGRGVGSDWTLRERARLSAAAAREVPRRHGGHRARLSSGVPSRRQRRRACRMGSKVSQVPSGEFQALYGPYSGENLF